MPLRLSSSRRCWAKRNELGLCARKGEREGRAYAGLAGERRGGDRVGGQWSKTEIQVWEKEKEMVGFSGVGLEREKKVF